VVLEVEGNVVAEAEPGGCEELGELVAALTLQLNDGQVERLNAASV
jgi:hypothetical protein